MKTARLARDGIVVVACLASACGEGGAGGEPAPPALAIPEGCQPLLVEVADAPPPSSACLAPYPSDFHRAGERVGLRGAARPRMPDGAETDPHDVNLTDGASLIPTIVGALSGDVVRDGLPGVLDDPRLSARAESGTVLVDAETGAFVPHYTDVVARGDWTRTSIVLRTFSPLRARTRYVVGITGARLESGQGLAPAPEGFRRLRDGATMRDPALASLATRFDSAIFAPLSRAGVARERLQLAWDFTTGSAELPKTDMLRVRELTLAWLDANEPAARVVATRSGTGELARLIDVEVAAPLFLQRTDPGSPLFRDVAGQVAQNGTTTFKMLVVVPKSIEAKPEPARLLGYGHGFFGGTQELEGDAARTIAERTSSILFGVEWWGMSKPDIAVVSDALATRPDHMADFAERTHQAMANWIVATAAMRSVVTSLPELRRGAQPIYDPSFVGYFGASQGHILGGTLAALSPDFSRVVLNVGGGGFTHVMPRSLNFGPFGLLLAAVFKDPLMVQAFVAMFQRPLDRVDPITWAPHVFDAKLPRSPDDRRVLMQIGLGDAAVPNVGSFLHARALGLPIVTPSPLEVFGLAPVAATDAPSSLTVFDFRVDTTGYAEGKPVSPNAVHDTLRKSPAALRQMETFLKPGGVITHACDGVCDPE